jgi:hypothetical protein
MGAMHPGASHPTSLPLYGASVFQGGVTHRWGGRVPGRTLMDLKKKKKKKTVDAANVCVGRPSADPDNGRG